MLRVSLLGNLGADPELRTSQRGNPVASFRVAVHQVQNSPEGERQDSTEWFRVRATGRQSDFAQRLQKGARVLVAGRLEISRYQSREGEPRVGFEVWADEIVNLAGRPEGSEADASSNAPPREEPVGIVSGAPQRPTASSADNLDDLPF